MHLILDRHSCTSFSDQIVASITGQIQSGRLPSGSRLLSIRKFASVLGVSASTVVLAYDKLSARGLISCRATSGYFVAAREVVLPSFPKREHRFQNDPVWQLRRMLEPRMGMLLAGSGYLPESWLEDMLSARLLSKVARSGMLAFSSPATALGFLPLRKQLALRLGQSGVSVHHDQIILTTGATQALDVIIRSLLVPDDVVVIEDPTFYGLAGQLIGYGARLIPIPRLSNGPDVDSLETACRTFRPKVFFTQTLMQNPTGTSTDVAVAARLLAVAERYNITLVEDEVYGDLFPGRQSFSISQLDRSGRVIQVGGFSKTISPNIRVGYIVAPAHLVDVFIEKKMLTVLASSEFDERLVYEILSEGRYNKHLERVRVKLAREWQSVVSGLSSAGLIIQKREFATLFAWAELPAGIDENLLVQDAAENGIFLTPGSVFSVNRKSSSFLRFSVAASNTPRLFDYLRDRISAIKEFECKSLR